MGQSLGARRVPFRSGETLVKVAYFSAYATWLPERYARHRLFVTALETARVECHMARFNERIVSCRSCGARWTSREEKETDVHFALTFLEDASDDFFDRAIIVSADSDYVPRSEKSESAFPARKYSWRSHPRGTGTLEV